jgi:GT2 family glycosyltransferase
VIDTSIVIANFNNPELIKTCLQSIDEFVLRSGLEVIVVDNGSENENLEILRADRPHLSVKYLPKNMGFGYAINRGVELARGRDLVILNSDVEITDFSLQTLLTEFALANSHSLWSPNLFDSDGHHQLASLPKLGRWTFWIQFSVFGEAVDYLSRRFGMSDVRQNRRDERVSYLYGTCLILKKEDFIRVGGFDEKYFLYFEDLDFCDRFRKIFGKSIWLKSCSQIIHQARGSSAIANSMNWHYQRSKYVYAREAFGRIFAIALIFFDTPLRFFYMAMLRIGNRR